MTKRRLDTNKEIAEIFSTMAACYRYMGREQRFRSIAYERASKTISSLDKDLKMLATDIAALDKLENIGVHIAEKIIEYLKTGRIKTFDQLQKKIPTGLLELMDIRGVGPATIRLLHQKLGIQNKEGLEKAIQHNKLDDLKGFGKKRIENIRKAMKMHKESSKRMMLDLALRIGEDILSQIRKIPGVQRAEIAGSLRRMKETIGDLDILATCEARKRKSVIKSFTEINGISNIIASGDTKASVLLSDPQIQVDIRLVDAQEFGAAWLYFTGSREHNIQLRTLAKEKGCKINEYGIFREKDHQCLAAATEESIYTYLDLSYIEPEIRENWGEIDLAKKHQLPKLIAWTDLKGDMQMHSNWSDGATDIMSMAKRAMAAFPSYEYIVLTDHSPSSRIAHGLDQDRFKKQWEEIDKVNDTLGMSFVLKGVEVDIRVDGSLDLPDEFLKNFDWVTASIHSGFSKDNTNRLIKACSHPMVDCIGHPSGRLMGKRDAYPIDWEKLFESAAATGTVLEINAQPSRLDLSDEKVREAMAYRVMFSISSDAHDPHQLLSQHLGVAVARRAGCEKKHIINTMGWKAMSNIRKHKQRTG